MKLIISFLILILSSNLIALSKAGDEVRNGGGIAEQYLTYALRTLPRSIDMCLRTMLCEANANQKILLKKIKASIPMELQAEILQFTSSAKRPGLFTINGVERMAVTADYVGAPVYYNTSMLYDFKTVQITIGGAIQSLIHELGHHQGEVDHDSLEMLGSEVRKTFERFLMEAPYSLNVPEKVFSRIEIRAISTGSDDLTDKDNGSLELLFKDKVVNITSDFESLNSKCESSVTRPVLRSSFQFFNLHWIYKVDEQTSGYKYLAGNVRLNCRDKYSRVHKKNFEFTIRIKTFFNKNIIYQSHEFVEGPTFLYTEHIKLFREVGKL